jgi:phytoene desaturase
MQKQAPKAIVIGAGFAGLSAATSLAYKGLEVTLLEKNGSVGGRARRYSQDGFTFDMGPSWYWMPDVFDTYFESFGVKTSDYYKLHRLDPSYRVIFGPNNNVDLSASMDGIYELFESKEPGSSKQLKEFLDDAAYKYEIGINELVYKPGRSLLEFADMRVLKGLLQLDLLSSIRSSIRKRFKNSELIQILEFPVLFLGATPSNTPALYSLMNYADMVLGTWYPEGGMYSVVEGFEKLAVEQGVDIQTNVCVTGFDFENRKISAVKTDKGTFKADIVVATADYQHVDQHLLPKQYRNYSAKYWDSRKLAPSSLIFYLGLNRKYPQLLHHTLCFDEDFALHAEEIYKTPMWPTKPLFYLSVPSATDPNAAPLGCENIFVLMPVAPGIEDNEATREKYYNLLLDRLERLIGEPVKAHVIMKRSYAHKDFISDYNSFKGNAYGLANTLDQTAILKPSLKSKKLSNLYFSGQLTTPGPGVPPTIISGMVVAEEISKDFKISPNPKHHEAFV